MYGDLRGEAYAVGRMETTEAAERRLGLGKSRDGATEMGMAIRKLRRRTA